MAKKTKTKAGMISVNQTVADNRRARFDYFLEEKFEAGIVLTGTEVKSLRLGQCSLNESYAQEKGGEIWLINAHIPEYKQAGPHLQHAPKQPRKLLLKEREINRLIGKQEEKGLTLLPLKIYFKDGKAKCELAVAKGKKLYDKRADAAERDAKRQAERAVRRDID